MLGLITAINALIAKMDEILDQIEIIAENTTPAESDEPPAQG